MKAKQYSKDDLWFQIDQLRKDKIIYAVEAIAVNTLCFVSIFIGGSLIKGDVMVYLSILAFVSIGYTLFMGLGNAIRLRKIKQLEKMLENKM